MCATHATKNGVRYRYYVSQPYLRGIATPPPGAITRVPAADIEAALIRALKANLRSAPGPAGAENLFDHDMIASSVSRIEVRKNQLAVWLRPSPSDAANVDQASDGTSGLTSDTNATPLLIPWCKPPFRKSREILLPASVSRHQVRPLNAERRASLLKSIARGRQWLNEIVSGAVHDVEQIAQRHKCSVRHVNMTISMAFIAPSLVEAAVRRSSAARDWRRQLARCTGRMVASVRTAWADRAIKGWVLVDVRLRKPNHPFSFSPLPKRRPNRQERDFSGRRPSPQNGLVRRQERRDRRVK